MGVVVGFPWLTAIAMRNAPASSGAVIIELLPLTTAWYGVWQGKEQVSRSFWIFALMGSGLVVCFALLPGTKSLGTNDLALFQLQLLQPFLTILASAILLHEPLTVRICGFAVGVIICVASSKRFRATFNR